MRMFTKCWQKNILNYHQNLLFYIPRCSNKTVVTAFTRPQVGPHSNNNWLAHNALQKLLLIHRPTAW